MQSRIKVLLYQLLLILALFQISRLLFIGFNQALFQNMAWSIVPFHILHSIKFDLTALCLVNGPFILLSLLPFRNCEKRTYQYFLMALYAVTNTVALVANFVDIFYYPYTLKRLTFSIFGYLGTQANMSSLGLEFLITYWYAFVVMGFIVFLLIRFYLFTLKKLTPINDSFSYKKASALWLLSTYVIVAGCNGNINLWGNALSIKDAITDVSQPEEAGIVLNSAFTIISSYMEKTEKPAFFSRNELNAILPPVHPSHNDSTFRPDNVVIIILESFTRETFQSLNQDLDEGQYKGYAPFLDSLMQESLYFTHASANGRKSIDALPAILASIPANQTPFILANEKGEKVESLASHLRQRGYKTMFFHGSHNTTMGFAKFCQSAGVTHYLGLNEYPHSGDFDGTWGIWDEPYLQYMAEELTKCKEPFLSTVFTLSSHNPFVVPDKYKNKFPKGTNGIHETMGYTDHALRAFFNKAKAKPWFNNTLFVITADHCITPCHKEYATSENAFAVPLMFYAPGRDSMKGKREERVQHIDIFPTVLNYLHYNEPFNSAGHNLLDPQAPKFTVNLINQCYQMTQGDYLLLFDGQKSSALFNLKEDRYQKHNLLSNNTQQVNQMETLLKAWIQRYNPQKH